MQAVVFDELHAPVPCGPAMLLKAASVGFADVTVSKLSTLKLTVFDWLAPVPTLVAESGVVLAGQYHVALSGQIIGELLI